MAIGTTHESFRTHTHTRLALKKKKNKQRRRSAPKQWLSLRVRPAEVLVRPRVDIDLIANVHKERNLDDRPGIHGGRLAAALCRVAFNARIGFQHLESHGVGQADVDHFTLHATCRMEP